MSTRWLRKKPRSKAGSPACAHSKSSRIRPPACTRMFLGLKSPRTSVRSSSGSVHGGDQRVDARGQVRMPPRGRPVVGIDPQLVEQARVGQRPAQGGMARAVGVDRAQDRAQPRGDVGIDLARHQLGLPGDRVVRGAGHREQVVRAVLEQDLGDRAFGQDRRQDVERGRLGPDPVEPGAPLHRDAQPLAALLDHERRLARDVDPQHDVGDARRLSSRTWTSARLGDASRSRGGSRRRSRRRFHASSSTGPPHALDGSSIGSGIQSRQTVGMLGVRASAPEAERPDS